MKRFTLVLLILAASAIVSSAQNRLLTVGKTGTVQNESALVRQTENNTTIRFELNEVELIEVATDYGKAVIVMSDKAPLMLEKGAPELFYLTSSFIIPDRGTSELTVSYGAFTDYENIEIAPSKGNLSRDVDPQTLPFVKGEVYAQNKFYPENLTSLREPFIMRDVRGQSLDVYPVQYNPVTKVLRVYSEITVSVVNNIQNVGINEFTNQKRHQTADPAFRDMCTNLFINYSSLDRGYPTGEGGEILVICHDAFMSAMKPYIDWKRTIGRKATMVATSVTGTSASALKSYITNYYNNPANNLAYVLLVGDDTQIQSYTYSNSSSPNYSIVADNYLGQLTGNDRYMEVLIGRMSAESVTHVETQVKRTIWYERDLTTTTGTWLTNAVGLSVREPGSGHDGGEDDYQHMDNIRSRLLTYGYNPVYQEYYNNVPGISNTSLAQITSRFNAGAGMANYCNHGSEVAWTFQGGLNYSNTQVSALQNAGKLPFIFSVACLNGRFIHSQPCFAETWMRATQSNEPTGAVATFMATISIGWQPPMTAQDEFVDLCLGITHTVGSTNYGITNNTIRTFAGAAMNASQKMLLVHGTGTVNTNDFDSWTVFGDPTLMIRTKTPQTMTVSYDSHIFYGMNEFPVSCNTEGALATMSYKDGSNEVVILGTATVSGGVANIALSETINAPGTFTIAVVAHNRVTHIGEVVTSGLACEKPVNLSVVHDKNAAIISWEDSDDMEGILLGYNIYRNGTKINTGLVAAQEYRDANLANGTYTYKVSAIYDHCQSSLTDGVSTVIEMYAVNYNSPANGSLSVSAGTATIANGALINAGTIVTIAATPNEHYLLQTLVVNGDNFTNGNTYTVRRTTTINCSFRGINPTVTNISVNGNSLAVSDNICYMSACGEDNIALNLSSEGKMKVNGASYTAGMTVPLTNDKAVINIESTGTSTKNYTLTVSKALGSVVPLYIERWGKTLAVVNNPERNGGHRFDNYRWFLDNNPLSGSNGGYILLNAWQAKDYSAEVHSTNTGEWHKLCHNVMQQNQATAMAVYPNPVDAGALLNINLPDDVATVTVNFYDISGNLVHQQKEVFGSVKAPNYSGLYVMEIQLPDGTKNTQQVMVR